jgi:hypothetical protein
MKVWEIRIGIGCWLFAVVFAVYSALFSPPADADQWPWLLVVMISMLIVSIIQIWFHHLVSFGFAVTSSTVIQYRQQSIKRQLDWGQIQELRFRRTNGQLELRTIDPDTSIRVEKQLEGFDLFVQFAEECTGLETRIVWW